MTLGDLRNVCRTKTPEKEQKQQENQSFPENLGEHNGFPMTFPEVFLVFLRVCKRVMVYYTFTSFCIRSLLDPFPTQQFRKGRAKGSKMISESGRDKTCHKKPPKNT